MNTDEPNNTDGDSSKINEESSSSSNGKRTTEPVCKVTSDQCSIIDADKPRRSTVPVPASVVETRSKSTPTGAKQQQSSEGDDMKRASARKLIERYFYQLVDGCGNTKCNNKHCASSGKVEKLTPNAAAARAIQLFTQEAELCDAHPSKVPKTMANASSTTSVAGDEESSSGIVAASSSAASASLGITDSNASINWRRRLPGGNIDMIDLNDSPNAEMDSVKEDEQNETSTRKNRNHHYEGGGSEEDSTRCVRVNTSQGSSSPSSFAGGSSKTKLTQKDSAGCGKKKGATSGSHSSKESSSKEQRDSKPIEYLDEAKLRELIATCERESSDTPLIRTLGAIFSSQQSIAASFQKKASSSIDAMLEKAPEDLKNLKKEDLRILEGDLDKDEDSCAEKMPETKDKHHTSVDLTSLRRSIKALYETKSAVFGSINNALQSLGESLGIELRVQVNKKEDIDEVITVFVIVFEVLQIASAEFLEGSLPSICAAVCYLPLWAQARLAHIWSVHCRDHILPLLQLLQQLITVSTLSLNYFRDVKIHDNEIVCNATKVMKIVFYANILAGEMEPKHFREADLGDIAPPTYLSLIPEDDEPTPYSSSKEKNAKQQKIEDPLAVELDVNILDCRRPHIAYSEFYNEPLCDVIEMDHDYLNYKNTTSDGAFFNELKKFSFMLYSFILTPATKTLALYYDSRIRMYSERRLSFLHQQLGGGLQSVNPYLKLKIRRDHIIDDALVELEMIAMSNPKDLKKQLVVEFSGEQGIDEGGVSKEFFQLIIEEIFNPDYGMFINNEDTNTVWFNSTSFENEAQFTLIGIVLGLAIYNNIILAVNFPMVVYRKLMGMKGSFGDLKDWNPVLFNSLKSMLDYQENDMEEVFMQTFKICYKDVFGTTLDHELKPDGDKIFVNQDNKQEFVDSYTDFLLNQSIEKQFKAFKRGFQMVTDESPLHLLFRPEEIELIVCGSKEFDFNELEQSTEYEGGFTAESQVIKDFWEIVHGLSMDSKRKLLQFTTGSDRVPVGGLSRLKLVIARNGPDCERLPTSHTCFNVLLLPEYSTKEKLEERLLKAINYSKGFGML
ncbi:ubiquitin-protein ligase E3A [Toxorhynchites rutilus septentrionalis]|uniref:ubiquitin-protein ligase E3A n=1 Tax=Toxorhynchites rutilus septentrionalis TaxID=329112 RepID=UPI002479E0D3|nr:ubiquitin-protein ligase E3A [Toxorhynchites rutilus septentrionalis]